jgi:hypothetical protein
MSTDATLRGWLLAEIPQSKLQARCQRIFIGWLDFKRNPIAMIGLLIIVGLVAIATLAPWITTSNGLELHLADRLKPPSSEHWFGTDELGRDIFDRIIWGSRITLYIVALVTIIVVPIGLLIGTVAGYMGGWVDTVLMRLTDIFLAFPRLILAMALVAVLGRGLENAVLAIAPDDLVAICAHCPCRGVDDSQQRIHPRGADAGHQHCRHSGAPCHTAVHVLGHCSPYTGHGRHHPDRGRAWFSWPRGAATDTGMGRDDFARSTIPDRPVVGANHSRDRHSRGEPGLQPAR